MPEVATSKPLHDRQSQELSDFKKNKNPSKKYVTAASGKTEKSGADIQNCDDTIASTKTSSFAASVTSPENGMGGETTLTTTIPETVLQFQRQLRKTQAAKRASAPLDRSQLKIIHNDKHMVVVNKPSGVLTVPGINSNPSMLTLLYEKYREEMNENINIKAHDCAQGQYKDADVDCEMKREHMIIHRLDMDTSGIVAFAKTKKAMSNLQHAFRERKVQKIYEAIVCGHLHPSISSGIIDLPLQRDHRFPPFMRVATPESERAAKEVVKDLNHAGWKKIVKKKAKPSQTLFQVMERNYVSIDDSAGDKFVKDKKGTEDGNLQQTDQDKKELKRERFPVTRLKLTPITGRTHQLRVHCAGIGHPILADPTYGIYGEASPNGGFDDDALDAVLPSRADTDLQLSLDEYAKTENQVMCLHARELRLKHPDTEDDIILDQPPDF